MQTTCVNCGKSWEPAENEFECPSCGWDLPGGPPPPPGGTATPASDTGSGYVDPFGTPPEDLAPTGGQPTSDPHGGNPFLASSSPVDGPTVAPYQPPAKKGMSTTTKVLIGVGVAIVGLMVMGVLAAVLLFNRATSVIEAEGGADLFGGTASTDLGVGACYDTASPGVEVACSDTHTHEVFGLIEWTKTSSYPSELDVFAEVYCEDLFQAYVGIDYFESDLWYETARPSEAAWDSGDRDIRCVLYQPGTSLTGSEFGSAR